MDNVYKSIVIKSKGGKDMLKTNKEKVVRWSVQGKIHHPLNGVFFRFLPID
jgi:hypothetical protein